jgi:signal peptidase I
VRALVEWLTLLAISVSLFRCFGIEGYMISTGSMAPSLLGYHTRVTCPACGLTFALGIAVPEEHSGHPPSPGVLRGQAVDLPDEGPRRAACPNCSRVCAAGADAAPTEGDQLLVHKDAYAWRRLAGIGGPRRWEIVVFRQPDEAHAAYVKRVVGLPGETIELREGDVYANGHLQRKSLTAQLSTRIPVSLNDYRVLDDDPDWQPRWASDDSGSSWRVRGSAFESVPRTASAGGAAEQSAWDWMTYRHWIRSGGATSTSVALPRWPDDVQPPDPLLSPLEYDSAQQRLMCLGALPHAQWERWDSATTDREFQQALWRLYRESHVVALTDASPYNPPGAARPNSVCDLQLELTLEWRGGRGAFAIEMTDGSREFRRGVVQLIADGEAVLYEGPLRVHRGAPTVLLMSTFDRQLLLAQDGQLVCEPIPYEREADPAAPLRRPVRFGVRDAAVTVAHVGLYRDVYYTPAADR